jgi:hypothetical protein
VLAPPAPAPFVDDIARRVRITRTLLSPLTPRDEYRRLVRRHDVDWFVLTPAAARRLGARVQAGDLEPERTTSRFVVFRVREDGRKIG